MTVATVMMPTTGDRGLLLPLTLGHVQAQSERDIEIFVMGDGVDADTRAVILAMAADDPRIRFFDHPKHVRRGEPNRHAALAEARGRIVCYATDRDLMLPNHVAVMADLLRDADFAHTLRFGIGPRGGLYSNHHVDITHPADRAGHRASGNLIPLGFAGHTLAMYRRLPHGWRTTPVDQLTDRYMWAQFLDHPDCRTASGTIPTMLYFNRSAPPAWSTLQRLEELRAWQARVGDPARLAAFVEEVRDFVIRDRFRMSREGAARERALAADAERERAQRVAALAAAETLRQDAERQDAERREAGRRDAGRQEAWRRAPERWRAALGPMRADFRAWLQRRRRYYATEPPRSRQPNVSDLEGRELAPGLRLEIYWLGAPSGPAPSASVYAGDDEVMRFDCFGGGKGHMHLNMRQARLVYGGGAARLAFGPGDVEDDIARAAFELTHNLGYALKLNRRAATRALAPHPKDVAAAAEWLRTGLLRRLKQHGA